MRARDLMTFPVATVEPQTPIAEVARILHERRISAVPVLADGKLAGIVSEADLLCRHEIGTDYATSGDSWWARVFIPAGSPPQYIRTHGTRARDVMTSDVVSVGEDAPLARVAMLLVSRNIRRLPVMRGGELVGIVSRSDLVRALAGVPRVTPANQSDASMQERLEAELEREPWWRAPYSNVTVRDGVVYFYGLIGSEPERRAARVAVESVLGERPVEDHRSSFYESNDV